MRYYCSYFDRNYLARGLVLLESLSRNESQKFIFIVICLDELTRLLLLKLNNPSIVVIALHELERGDQMLVEPRQKRSVVEYYWTLSPTAIQHALDFVPENEVLFYLDSDLCFFSDPAPILSEIDNHSVLIHEHRYAPEFEYLAANSGRFNVGLLGFRNDVRGRGVLAWWRDRCNEWCFARFEEGKFGDQMYLDDWPTRFEGVHVMQHIGGGVAPWNHSAFTFTKFLDIDGGVKLNINSHPFIFFHFHGLVPLNPRVYLLIKHPSYPLPELLVTSAYLPYVARMEFWNNWLRAQISIVRFGYWPSQQLFPGAALLIRASVNEDLEGVAKIPLSEGWTLLPGTQVRKGKNSLF